MSYLERNVNFILLFLLVILVLGFVGTTVYFQKSLREVNDRFHDEENSLKLVREELQGALNRLSDVNKSYALTARDLNESVVDFNQKYSNATGEKQKVEIDLAKTRAELKVAKNELQLTRFDLANVQSELTTKKTELEVAQSQLSALNAKIKTIKDDATSAEGRCVTALTKIDGYLQSYPTCDVALQSLRYEVRLIKDKVKDIQTR